MFLVAAQAMAVVFILAQLARLQVIDHERLLGLAEQGHLQNLQLAAPRGRVWDRNHDLLVGNVSRYQVTADAGNVVDINRAVNALSPVLGMPPGDLRAGLAQSQTHVLLATELPMVVGDAVNKLNLWAVYAVPYWRRAYPEGTLAAHVLGFVNAEGSGYYGVEGYYDAPLHGEEKTIRVVHDVWSGISPFDFSHTAMPRPGVDLVLTIDRTFQALTEGELARALADTGAQSGTIIVLDPRTGDILAMASLPTFDPNVYPDTPTANFANPAISFTYEPGSVFKILTMAAALQAGLVQPDTTYNDTACTELGGQLICNWDRRGHGTSTMRDLLAYSSNVGAATLSTGMGARTFYRNIQAFGIGQPTGIDLQGEAYGNLRTPGDLDWHESDLATNAFGQGLAVTPIQMIAAVAAVANEGIMMRPHVVGQMINGGQIQTARPTVVGRPISAKVARTLTEMLAQAVEREVPLAQVPNYRIAGKTGTAQIPIPGGYDDPWTIASFIGYGPVRDPRLVILVKLDRPTISPYGSTTAAPVFQRLAARLFVLMGIAPDDQQLASQQ
jgi:cell division protein FtsI/penicillin-binding protein 2